MRENMVYIRFISQAGLKGPTYGPFGYIHVTPHTIRGVTITTEYRGQLSVPVDASKHSEPVSTKEVTLATWVVKRQMWRVTDGRYLDENGLFPSYVAAATKRVRVP